MPVSYTDIRPTKPDKLRWLNYPEAGLVKAIDHAQLMHRRLCNGI